MAGGTPAPFLIETMASVGAFAARCGSGGGGEAGGPGQGRLVEGHFLEGRGRVLQETRGRVIVHIVYFGSEQHRWRTRNRRI